MDGSIREGRLMDESIGQEPFMDGSIGQEQLMDRSRIRALNYRLREKMPPTRRSGFKNRQPSSTCTHIHIYLLIPYPILLSHTHTIAHQASRDYYFSLRGYGVLLSSCLCSRCFSSTWRWWAYWLSSIPQLASPFFFLLYLSFPSEACIVLQWCRSSMWLQIKL